MNALFSVVLKELRLIRSQKISLALIIIYPLLIISALGLAFGGTIQAQRVNLALFIPGDTLLGPFNAEKIVNIIEDTNRVNIQLAASPEQVKELVKAGTSDFGLIIRKEKTEQGQVIADLFLDNSNFIVSEMFSPIAKSAIQIASFEISSTIIQQLWDELLPIRDDLQEELGNIDSFLTDLENAGEKISSLQQTILALDVSDLLGTLSTQAENIELTKQVLQQFNSDYLAFKAEIADTREPLESADAKLEAYDAKVSEQIRLMQKYRDNLFDYENRLTDIADDSTTPSNIQVNISAVRDNVRETRQQLDSTILELQEVKSDIGESRQLIADMRQNLDSVEETLDREKGTIDSMNSVLEGTTSDLAAMNAQLGGLGGTISDVNKLIADSMIVNQDIGLKMRNSKTMLHNFMDLLGELGKLNPFFLAHPIQANELQLYEKITPLAFIIPIALGLVLLLTCFLFSTMSVITEKNDGIYARMRLSSTNSFTLIAGKMIGQMLFAFLVSFMILAIGIIGFATNLQINPLDLIAGIALVSFSFIALGLFITNFAKTQSTAILGSLILIMPMIFLSGTILPLQLMNPTLHLLSSFLPLTAANKILLALLLKGVPLASMAGQVAILIVPALALVAYTIKKF